MRIIITSVDYAPEEFEAAVPIDVKLLRQIAGPDRPDYWLGEVLAPFEYTVEAGRHLAKHLVLAARWQGTQIEPNAEHLPINIAAVTDDCQLSEEALDFSKSNFVAIGLANEVEGGRSPESRTSIKSGTIGHFFGTGPQL
jgi:hypothetical protein